MTRGRGGVWLPPENDDVIYDQPLICKWSGLWDRSHSCTLAMRKLKLFRKAILKKVNSAVLFWISRLWKEICIQSGFHLPPIVRACLSDMPACLLDLWKRNSTMPVFSYPVLISYKCTFQFCKYLNMSSICSLITVRPCLPGSDVVVYSHLQGS